MWIAYMACPEYSREYQNTDELLPSRKDPNATPWLACKEHLPSMTNKTVKPTP